MLLPQSDKFEQLLASFSPSRPISGENWREFVAVPKREANDEDFRGQLPSISFWYRENSDLGLERVLAKIVDCLKEANHPANLDLAATISAIFAHTETNGSSAVERFNRVFLEVVASDLTQVAIIRYVDLPSYQFQVGPFTIGPFNPENLAYRCKKSGSDYFERYEKQLRKLPFSIERRFRSVPVVFWHRLLGIGPKEWTAPAGWSVTDETSLKTAIQAVEHYFDQTSALNFTLMLEELSAVQEIPTALGSGTFAVSPLHHLLGGCTVSVYLNIGGEKIGFVSASSASSLNINMGGGNEGIPFTEAYLREKFQFVCPNGSEIHQSLKSFCRFLALGVEHKAAGRLAEGFLHHVIALDLLLGEASGSSASVSSRCAALTHRALGQSFALVEKEIQSIYKARSKYVHEGKQPEPNLFPTVQRVAREVAFCLLRLQTHEDSKLEGFTGRWFKEIDFLVAAIEAQRPLSDDDWRKAGVGVPGEPTSLNFDNEMKVPFIQIPGK